MFKIEIDTSGSSFKVEDDNGKEILDPNAYAIRRILTSVEKQIVHGRTEGVCLDANGNKCGKWLYKEEK